MKLYMGTRIKTPGDVSVGWIGNRGKGIFFLEVSDYWFERGKWGAQNNYKDKMLWAFTSPSPL